MKLSDLVTYFRECYEVRRNAGLIMEKANSIYAKGGYTDAQAQQNILSNPFIRFEDIAKPKRWESFRWMNPYGRNSPPVKNKKIEQICDQKLQDCFARIYYTLLDSIQKYAGK